MKKFIVAILACCLLLTACTVFPGKKESVAGILSAISNEWVEIATEDGVQRVEYDAIRDEDGVALKADQLENELPVVIEKTSKSSTVRVPVETWEKMRPTHLPGADIEMPSVCWEDMFFQKTLEEESALPEGAKELFEVAANYLQLKEYEEAAAVNVPCGTKVYGWEDKLLVEQADGAFAVYRDRETLKEYNASRGFVYMVRETEAEIRLLDGTLLRVEAEKVKTKDGLGVVPLAELATSSYVEVQDEGIRVIEEFVSDQAAQVYFGACYYDTGERENELPEGYTYCGAVEYDVVEHYPGDLSYEGAAHGVAAGAAAYKNADEKASIYLKVGDTYHRFENKK